jgi:hypothetical protein
MFGLGSLLAGRKIFYQGLNNGPLKVLYKCTL